jgi:Holliday junction resolvase
MPNKNYLKGRRLEYEVCKAFKDAGCQAWRSAGSHGPYDVQIYGHGANIAQGWVLLQKAGFIADDLDIYIRKHDTLYYKEFTESGTPHDLWVVLIQCKRLPSKKGKPRGKNK